MYCISISHKRAPAYIREQYAFTKPERSAFMKLLKQQALVDGAVMVCTCNRSELYFSSKQKRIREEEFIDQVKEAFAAYKHVPKEEFCRYLNIFEGEAAIAHLFKVCGGLESKILGEDEILRQVKEAYEEAKSESVTDYELNLVFQKAVACAKKIKTDTEISNMPISIATLVANEVAHWEKEGVKAILLMGMSGKIGGDVAKNISCKPRVKIYGTTRNYKQASHNQKEKIEVISYSERYKYIDEADIIISATASPHYTLCANEVEQAVTKQKQRLFLDLAMPRDLDPKIEQMEGVTLRNIDYFDTISKENGNHKLEELDRAMVIMEEEKNELLKELAFHEYRELIPEWKELLEQVPLEKILYRMKKKADVDSLRTVLKVFDNLGSWVKEE